MNEGHEFYDPKGTGHCQIITGVGHFPESIPSRCWWTQQQHDARDQALEQRPRITTVEIGEMTPGVPFLQQLTATGTEPIYWSVRSLVGPSELRELGSSTGEWYFLPPAGCRDYDLIVRASNIYGHDEQRYARGVYLDRPASAFLDRELEATSRRLEELK